MIQASAGGGSQLAGYVASVSQGFAGADLANVVNEAALLGARRGKGAHPLSTRPSKGPGDPTSDDGSVLFAHMRMRLAALP
jgi:hypothetical protein